jgi:hypothetical protein
VGASIPAHVIARKMPAGVEINASIEGRFCLEIPSLIEHIFITIVSSKSVMRLDLASTQWLINFMDRRRLNEFTRCP